MSDLTATPKPRPMRRRRAPFLLIMLAACALLLAAVALPALAQRKNIATKPTPIPVTARMITHFEAAKPDRVQFGPLRFRGGLVLSSPHADFGGLSGLRMDASGERFLSVTDRGMWVRGRLTYDGAAPTGIVDAEIAPLLGADGRPITTRRGWFDAEALAIDGDIAYVALERVHQILRYDIGRDGLRARGHTIKVPAQFRDLPSNRGIEALAKVPKGLPLAGTLIAISERALDAKGNIRGFLIGGATPGRFTVKRSAEMDITDAAIVPGGDLMILERHFSLRRGGLMRLSSVPLASIAPDRVVQPRRLYTADLGYEIDNMEGLGVHRDGAGATVLTLVSDDNFSPIQRTLLLQFTLTEAPRADGAAP